MLLPSDLDQWYAEAVTRVYAPWLTASCAGISGRQRREVSELIRRARRTACLPPLDAHTVRDVRVVFSAPSVPGTPHPVHQASERRPGSARTASGRWAPAAA